MAYDADWINEFDETSPNGGEAKNLGDNAIREIKRVLKETFPEAASNDPLTVPFGALSALVSQALPKDTLILWAGDSITYPDGPDITQWTVCDNRPRYNGGMSPNLVSRFILGAKTSTTLFAPTISALNGAYGGSNEINIVNYGTSTSINFTTNGTALTENQIPPHDHYTVDNSTASGATSDVTVNNPVSKWYDESAATDDQYKLRSVGSSGRADVGPSSETGGGAPHTHTFNIRSTPGVPTGANMPAYFAAVWLIKE
jgi:hypothetical protein